MTMLRETVVQLKALAESDAGKEQLLADVKLLATRLETHVEQTTPMRQVFEGISMEIDRLLRDEKNQSRFARVERMSQIAQRLKMESVSSVDDLVAQDQDCMYEGGGRGIRMQGRRGGGVAMGNNYVGAGAPYGMGGDPNGDPMLDVIREIAQERRVPAAVQRAQELRDLAQARKDLADGDLDTSAVDARIEEIQQQLKPAQDDDNPQPQPNGRDPAPEQDLQ